MNRLCSQRLGWLFGIGLLLTGACRERVQHGLDERQANELQAVLAERGIAARKVPEGGKRPTWSIEVQEGHASGAVRVLAELGLPRPAVERGCDLFGGTSFVRTPLEEQLCRVHLLERGLEKTLQSLDGVLAARVHLALPAPPRPGHPLQPAKASVLLRVQPAHAAQLRDAHEPVRALVAGGIEGLSLEAVSLWVDEVSARVERPLELPGSGSSSRRVLAVALALALLSAIAWAVLRLKGPGRVRAPRSVPAALRPIVTGSGSRKEA